MLLGGLGIVRLDSLGEERIIDYIARSFQDIYLGGVLSLDDDASAFYMNGYYFILNIDGFSSYNSKYPWNTWESFGWKAVTSCSSDLISKGAKPIMFLNSIGIPKNFDFSVLESIMKGIKRGIVFYRGLAAGGDINASAKDVWIDIACIGLSEIPPIPRTAREGDYIIATGYYGASYIAMYLYRLLSKGEISVKDIPQGIVEKTSWPYTRIEILDVIYKYRNFISGSIDTSDGLGRSLHLISKKSNRIINLLLNYSELAEELIDPEIRGYLKLYELDHVSSIFKGGEEFEVVLSVRKEVARELVDELEKSGVPAHIIGEVSSEKGVGVRDTNKEIIDLCGFSHF